MLCPICSSNSVSRIIKRKDKYEYVHCIDCNVVFANPMPSDSEIIDFYNGFVHRKPSSSDFKKLSHEINEDVKKICDDINNFIPINGKLELLDCGGGTGFYSNAFSNYFNVTMIDIDGSACQYAREKFPNRFEVIHGDPTQYSFKKSYKIIFCNHVVEHYKNPIILVEKLNKILDRDGILIITTPNQNCKEFWFRPMWLYHYLNTTWKKYPNPISLFKFVEKPWICCDPPRHLFAFNSSNLKELIKKRYKILDLFTEYSPSQYYTSKIKYDDFTYKGPRSLIWIIFNMVSIVGIKLIRVLDKENKWGNNLVIILRKKV